MVRVRVIERRLPHGWEVLLVVNGVVGRAEEMLCLEERQLHPLLTKEQTEAIFLAWLKNLPGPKPLTLYPWNRRVIGVTVPHAESVNFVES